MIRHAVITFVLCLACFAAGKFSSGSQTFQLAEEPSSVTIVIEHNPNIPGPSSGEIGSDSSYQIYTFQNRDSMKAAIKLAHEAIYNYRNQLLEQATLDGPHK